ncbi:MAG: STAS domain-containing protein [Alphaproteobacteria bacterium]|nr:STAS domain-containing protein [Alphaproteobacteria bacterium]MCB9696684.1 STAS domain-containing protein [Alphaproteobacteria bacterium]
MDPSLTEVLQFDEHQLRTRLAFFRIGEEELDRLAAMRPLMEEATAQIVSLFYEHLLSQPETRDFLDDPVLVDRLQAKQTAYFLQLFEGRVDLAYVENRFRVGAAHERLGVPPRWYIGAFDRYLGLVRERLIGRGVAGAELVADLAAVERIMHFDAALAIDAYVAGHLATHARNQAALRELASPVIRVHDRVLLLPLVGTIDSFRAQQVMESALLGVSEEQARVLILDIAGVAVVDTQVADHLLKTTAALRLLGAKTILTGISPQVARTIVELGVDLKTLHTRNKLSDGLELALSLVGREITDKERGS